MSFEKYAVPQWIRESLPEKVEELEAAATRAAIAAVQPAVDSLLKMPEGFAAAAANGNRKTLVELVSATRGLCDQILAEIADAPATAAPRPMSLHSTPAVAGSTTVNGLTPEQQAKKARSNAVWYYIRDHLDHRYADPGDLKSKNPELHRSMYMQASELYDAGKLTPSGKEKAAG